jgi:hemerythrin
MLHVQWKERYRIGFKDIDDQHKRLLDLLNDLIDVMNRGGDSATVSAIFKEVCKYAVSHFAVEESYLEKANYPELGQQQIEHRTFIDKLIELDSTYSPNDPHLVNESIKFLKDWFVEHIQFTDLKYAGHLKAWHSSPKGDQEPSLD